MTRQRRPEMTNYYRIFGDVTDTTGVPVSGFTVEIFGVEGRFPQPVYTVTTNASGRYSKSFGYQVGLDLFYDDAGQSYDPNPVTIRVKSPEGAVVGERTYPLTWYGFSTGSEPIDVTVSLLNDDADPDCNCVCVGDCDRYRVVGWLRDAAGRGQAGKHVRVYGQNYRDRELLGSAITTTQGEFSIAYDVGDGCDPTGPGVSLVVEAREPGDPDIATLLANSGIIARPRALHKVELSVDCDTSQSMIEYIVVRQAIVPAMNGLEPETMELAQFSADQADVLTCRVAIPDEEIRRFLAAARAAATWRELHGGAPETVSLPALYALVSPRAEGRELETVADLPRTQLLRTLERAVAGRVIEALTSPDAEAIVDALRADVGGHQATDTSTTLGSILDLGAFAGAAAAERSAFVRKFVEHHGDVGDYWTDYRAYVASEAAGVDVDRLQLHLSLAGLTGQDPVLITQLESRMGSDGIFALRDFAALDIEGWKTVVGVPSDYPGEDAGQRHLHLATALAHRFEYTFPEVAIAAGLERAASDPSTDMIGDATVSQVVDYLRAHADLDLRQTTVKAYVGESPDHAASDELLAALAQIQRLFAVLEGYDLGFKIFELSRSGYDSALAIAAKSLEGFSSDVDGVFENRATRAATHARALEVTQTAGFLVKEAIPALNPAIAGIPARARTESGSPDAPNLESLFGSFDHCSCQHCQSIFSPSAYLVDLLASMDADELNALGCATREIIGEEPTGKFVRHHRRPDICHIDLECQNTLTPLPHIDITNELLEERVLWGLGRLGWNDDATLEFWNRRQTTWSAEQLRAHPEHLEAEVYRVLRSTAAHDGSDQGAYAAVRPWNLPFDLFLAESRGYLELAGTSRSRLLELFGGSQASIDRETLAVNDSVYAMLLDDSQPTESEDVADRRGLATMVWLGDPAFEPRDTHFAGSDAPPQVDDILELTSFEQMSHATQLSFAQLLELNQSEWVGHGVLDGTPFEIDAPITEDGLVDCDYAKAVFLVPEILPSPWPEFLQRVHRFVRLMGVTGLDIDALDECLQKLSGDGETPTIDPEVLHRLGVFTEQRRRFSNLSTMQALSWWADIEARPTKATIVDGSSVRRETLYDRLFLQAASAPNLDGASAGVLDRFRLTEVRDFDVADSHPIGLLGDPVAAHIAAAFEISGEDLQTLLAGILLEPFYPDLPEGPAKLTVRNLSLLHLRVSLARALSLEPTELLKLEQISGVRLSSVAYDADMSVYNTRNWPEIVEFADTLAVAELSVPRLDFVVGGAWPEQGERLVGFVDALREARSTVELAYEELASAVEASSSREVLQAELESFVGATALTSDVLESILAAVDMDPDTGGHTEWAMAVDMLPREQVAPALKTCGAGQSLYECLEFGTGGIADVQQRRTRLLTAIVGTRAWADAESRLGRDLEAMFDLEHDRWRALSLGTIEGGWVESIISSPEFDLLAVDELETLAALPGEQLLATLSSFPAIEAWLTQLGWLARAETLILAMGATATEIEWFLGPEPAQLAVGSDFAFTALRILATTGSIDFSSAIGTLQFSAQLRRLGTDFAGWRSFVATSFGAAQTDAVPDSALQSLASAYELDAAAILELAAQPVLIWGTLLSPAGFARLLDQLDFVAELGESVARIRTWATGGSEFDVDPATAEDIKRAAQSKFSASDWARAAGPARDQLRMAQRDALHAYASRHYELVGDVSVGEDGDVLDDESARLFVQAKSLDGWMLHDSFINPCRMTSRVREALSALQILHFQRNAFDANRIWQRRYRLWEVQRKLATYPENWLVPSLRDDKTPLFSDFEDELGAGPINDDTVERALGHYLAGLDEVARLEVNGTVDVAVDVDDELASPITHVFGRARGKVGKLWYRQRSGAGDALRWSPWARVPFETSGRDVLPVAYLDRVLIAWPSFEWQSDAKGSKRLKGETLDRHLVVRLSWAELHRGQWSDVYQARGHVLAVSLRGGEHCSTFEKGSKRRANRAERNILRCLRANASEWTRALESSQVFLQSRVDEDSGEPEIWVRFVRGSRLYDAGRFRFGSCGRGLESRAVHVVGESELTLHRPGPSPRLRGQRFVDRGRFALTRVIGQDVLDQTRATNYESVLSRDDGYLAGSYGFYQDPEKSFFAFTQVYDGYSALRGHDGTDLRAAFSGHPIANLELGVQTEWARLPVEYRAAPSPWPQRIRLQTFHHPFVCLLRAQLERHCIEGIYDPALEGAASEVTGLVRQALQVPLFSDAGDLDSRAYNPGPALVGSPPVDAFDFYPASAYGQYNWEIFYHIPMMIAQRLFEASRFADALRWLHFIFDPSRRSDDPEAGDFWRIKPFAGVPLSIEAIIRQLSEWNSENADLDGFRAGLQFLREHPFAPYGAARVRPACFMRATVMLYLDVLIGWGDQLFRQGSIESVAEATQLYVVAQNLLGPRPETLPVQAVAPRSWDDLGGVGVVGNQLVEVENLLHFAAQPKRSGGGARASAAVGKLVTFASSNEERRALSEASPLRVSVGGPVAIAGSGAGSSESLATRDSSGPRSSREFYTVPTDSGDSSTLYFCVPPNERLLGYWDLVDDRLYKVRYCLDLDGLPRTIRLFERPIDPGALISALSSGRSLAAAIGSLNAPPPSHRFRVHLAQAMEYVESVIRLGKAIEGAHAAEDSESFAQLEADHRVRLIPEERKMLESRIHVAEREVEATEAARAVFEDRRDHYKQLIETGISDLERAQTEQSWLVATANTLASSMLSAAGLAAIVPTLLFGGKGAGTPIAVVESGGISIGGLINAVASSLRAAGSHLGARAEAAGVRAGHERRAEEWNHQQNLAELDIERLDLAQSGALARIEIAKRELERNVLDGEQAEVIVDYLAEKYSRPQLYQWFLGRANALYYRTFVLALEAGLRARASFAREMGVSAHTMRLDAWDSSHDGLRAGEKLRGQLRSMSHAYYTQMGREYEITKRFSLARDNPGALLQLQHTGVCDFDVTEAHFDMDHPGHIWRRIQSVAVTLTSHRGAHASVPAELTLINSKVRSSSDEAAELEFDAGAAERIHTSGGLDDFGVFAESRNDGRYMPFEHRGAISSWRLRLPQCQRAFDYRTIGDVVLTLRYNAREGGEARRVAAESNLAASGWIAAVGEQAAPSWLADGVVLWRGISVRSQFNAAFRALDPAVAQIKITPTARMLALEHADLDAGIKVYCACVYEATATPPASISANLAGTPMSLPTPLSEGGQPVAQLRVGPVSENDAATPALKLSEPTTWTLDFDPAHVEGLADVLLYLQYTPKSQSAD